MPVTTEDHELHLVAPHRSIAGHVRDVWGARELLARLTIKELTVRYKKSSLGFFWSTLNPLVMLAVYSVAFSLLGIAFERFTIWLVTGLLVWNFFASGLLQGTGSVTNNAYLVGKVRFPREVLPLASIGAAAVHFVLQFSMVTVILIVVRQRVDWGYLWLLPLAILTLVVVLSAATIALSALNVYARDTMHLLELLIVAMFWLTPIGYPVVQIMEKLTERSLPTWLPMLNPVTPVVMAFQRALYGTASVGVEPNVRSLLPDESSLWYARNLGITLMVALVALALAIRWFDRVEGNFAEVM